MTQSIAPLTQSIASSYQQQQQRQQRQLGISDMAALDATYTDKGMLLGSNGVQLRSPNEIGTCFLMRRREKEAVHVDPFVSHRLTISKCLQV